MCDENRIDLLSNLIANLRDVFPFPSDVDLAEIIHSPEFCLEAMIRSCGWQPIETAPKDGSHILLWFDSIPSVAYYSTYGDLGFWIPSENLISDVIGELKSEWWMPLPPPPAGSP